MLGTNPIRPPVKGDGTVLAVQQIFSTLQGEGPSAGTPAVFVRLGGCNLACDFCDTEFESFETRPLDVVLETIDTLARSTDGVRVRSLVVITGGEPMRQPIELLCDKLLEAGFRVEIETNGTLYRTLPEEVSIICSPKNTGIGYVPIRADIQSQLHALKFILSKHHPLYKEVPAFAHNLKSIPIYVQPMDERDPKKNADNVEWARMSAIAKGYTLSLQTHKLMGMP